MTLRLSECGDTLSLEELLLVLGVKKSTYYNLKAHGITLVQPLPHLHRFSKSAVQAFLDSNGLQRLRRAG